MVGTPQLNTCDQARPDALAQLVGTSPHPWPVGTVTCHHNTVREHCAAVSNTLNMVGLFVSSSGDMPTLQVALHLHRTVIYPRSMCALRAACTADTQLAVKSTTYRSMATFRCKHGFSPNGRLWRGHWRRSKTCRADARWHGRNLQTCKAMQCRSLKAPLGGSISCTGRTGYDQKSCTFSCDKGLRIVGANKVTCQVIASGKSVRWNAHPPKCVGVYRDAVLLARKQFNRRGERDKRRKDVGGYIYAGGEVLVAREKE